MIHLLQNFCPFRASKILHFFFFFFCKVRKANVFIINLPCPVSFCYEKLAGNRVLISQSFWLFRAINYRPTAHYIYKIWLDEISDESNSNQNGWIIPLFFLSFSSSTNDQMNSICFILYEYVRQTVSGRHSHYFAINMNIKRRWEFILVKISVSIFSKRPKDYSFLCYCLCGHVLFHLKMSDHFEYLKHTSSSAIGQ